MRIDDHVVHRAAQLLDAHIGLKPEASSRARLVRALRDVAAARCLDHEALAATLSEDPSVLDDLLDRITVQETAFFRHPEQFESLRTVLLPAIAPPVRAWSAACANGQEAYSLAMLLAEAGVAGSVLATDVSPAALARTSAGRYAEREMGGVSARRRRRHFTSAGGRWEATPALRRTVTVRRHNLLDAIPSQVSTCQLVMCRNVLIYLTPRHATAFLDRLADVMDPDAHLFVGGAETIWQSTGRFEPVTIGDCYAYRLRGCGRGCGRGRGRGVVPVAAARATIELRPAPSPRPRDHDHERSAPASEAPERQVGARSDPQRSDPQRPDPQRHGRELLAAGRAPEAIVALRQWAYLSPDDPAAHLHLALALDDASEQAGARRAYRAALAALDRCDPARLDDVLGGYEPAELRRLLVERSRPSGVAR